MKSKVTIGMLAFTSIVLFGLSCFLLHDTGRMQKQIDARDSLINRQFDNMDTYDEQVDSLCASLRRHFENCH